MQTPDSITFLDRRSWGASPSAVEVGYPISPAGVVGLVLHHTVFAFTDRDRDGIRGGDLDDIASYMRQLQRARPDLGNEVPYSFVVFPGATDEACVIAEGRGYGRSGAHTAGLNSTRYGVAVAGNTDTDQPLTPGMIEGIKWVGRTFLSNPAGAVPTIGHQQAPPYYQNGNNLNATGCPGASGMADLVQLQPPFTTSEEDTEMPLTVEETEAIAIRVVARLANPETNPGTVVADNVEGVLARLDVAVNDPAAGVRAILARAVASPGVAVDVDALASALADELDDDLVRALIAGLGDALSNG